MAEIQDVAQNHHHHKPHHKPHRWWKWNWNWPWSRPPVVYDPYYQPYYTTPWTFKETMAFFISFFVIFGILYLIYYLTKTDKDVMINKDWDELKNMPLFWLTIVTGLIFLVGIVLIAMGYPTDVAGSNAKNANNDNNDKLFLNGHYLLIIGLFGTLISGGILFYQLVG